MDVVGSGADVVVPVALVAALDAREPMARPVVDGVHDDPLHLFGAGDPIGGDVASEAESPNLGYVVPGVGEVVKVGVSVIVGVLEGV